MAKFAVGLTRRLNWFLAETFAEKFWNRFAQLNRANSRTDEVLGASLKAYWLSAVEASWADWGSGSSQAIGEMFERSDYMTQDPEDSDNTFTEFIE